MNRHGCQITKIGLLVCLLTSAFTVKRADNGVHAADLSDYPWSFQPMIRHEPAAADSLLNSNRVRNPIDQFVLQELEKATRVFICR